MQNKIRLSLGTCLCGCLLLSLLSCGTGSERQQALDFLYESMPLPDSVDYPRDFWLRAVDATLAAKEEMPWGKTVPQREWKHFVLPLRVNNENLDEARPVLFDSLRNRVKNLSMYDAVLEVNHWCHEHATYQPSDSRTKSPLVTMRTSIGRCGEESTFTVAALRAVGIPARQVYTPRWAHTDDNHAWVEAWVDGEWHFLGACEPEAVLDLGWFNQPASRAILMHTKVFGTYDGPEEVVSQNKCYTEINVTENYAPVSKLVVLVRDAKGNPVQDAKVDFRVYNYAEFFCLASRQTDDSGLANLSLGCGDILVWASKDDQIGIQKASVGQQDTVRVELTSFKDGFLAGGLDLEFTPPSEHPNIPERTEEQIEENKRRLAYEDSLRNAYTQQAFWDGDTISCPDKRMQNILRRSRSNWKTLQDFYEADTSSLHLLSLLGPKDLQDVSLEVLQDMKENVPLKSSSKMDYFLASQRVSNEMLTPYRQVLSQRFVPGVVFPEELIKWTKDSILIDESRNPQNLCMSPMGVFRHRITDRHSRDIFFVAAARSAGIPARIDWVTGKVQWADEASEWHDVDFEAVQQEGTPKGLLALSYEDFSVQENPSYYRHFSLSKIEEGRPVLQELSESITRKAFAEGLRMDEGNYLLVSGTRLADGSVLAHLEFFQLQGDSKETVPLRMRSSEEQLQVIGGFDSESLYTTLQGEHKSLLSTTGRGYYVVGLIRSNHEPTNHALRDLAAVAKPLQEWGRSIVLLFADKEDAERFRRADFPALPENVVFGIADKKTVEALGKNELSKGEELPILFMADTFNRVVWSRQGYTIGLGEQLLQVIRKL